MSHKVSVIVPVYNAQDFLVECLESILAQTYRDYEVILVDDGSTDMGGAICDRYAEKDTRFKVIHQQNCGSSAARNVGIDNADSEYILFIDADDWVDSNHIESLVALAERQQADVVMCGYYLEYPRKQVDISNIPKSLAGRDIIIESLNNTVHAGVCLKLVRSSLLHSHQIRFPDHDYYEDMYLSIELLLYAGNIASTGLTTYHYRYNPSSETNRRSSDFRLTKFGEFVCNMQDLFDKHSFWKDEKMRKALYGRVNKEKLELLSLPYHAKEEIINAYGTYPDTWIEYKIGCSIIRLLNYIALRYRWLTCAHVYKHLRVGIKNILKGTK